MSDRPFRDLCPEADERDMMDDGEFWNRVARNHGLNVSESDPPDDIPPDVDTSNQDHTLSALWRTRRMRLRQRGSPADSRYRQRYGGRDMTDRPINPVDLFHELSGATAYAANQPKRRWSHEAKGKVLWFPRTEMVMVPFQFHQDGSWSCVVVIADPKGIYTPGGYSLNVGQGEIETAIEIDLTPSLVGVRIGQAFRKMAEQLREGARRRAEAEAQIKD
jgi:hypothetical protein